MNYVEYREHEENDERILYCRSFLLFDVKEDEQSNVTNIDVNRENNQDELELKIESEEDILSFGIDMNDFYLNKNTVLFFPFSYFQIISERAEKPIRLNYSKNKNIDDNHIEQNPNTFTKDLTLSNILSDRKTKERDSSLLNLKSTIIGEFEISKEQVGRKINLINPNKSHIKDYVEIFGDSEQKLFNTEEFKENKKYKITYNFSENFEDFTFLFKSIGINSLDLSKLKMGNITSVASMFSECKNLTSIDLSNKKLKKLEDLSRMFFNCFSLESVNLENFTSKKIKEMDYMFYKCKSLKHLNLKNLNTEGASINNIFFGVNKECKIEVENDEIKNEFNKIKNK